jgi:quercetin dioxygenase-like cupin family protein
VAEMEREREELQLGEQDPRHYYDYEGRFVKQRLERDRMRMLPRVVKPAMFATNGHALGDVRVFERFTVGPVSALTCRFLEVPPGGTTPEARRIPLLTMFVLEGSGTSMQDGDEHPFEAQDVVVVPPYTRHTFVAGPEGFRGWVPETRFWHVLGLLWHEHFEAQELPGIERLVGDDGSWRGYRVHEGVLGLERDLEIPAGAEPRREAVFGARRTERDGSRFGGDAWYDDFLRRLPEDNARHDATPRVVRGDELPWEDTRGGRMKFYVSNWADLAGQDLDLAMYEIPPGARSGTHRHIAEELLLVLEGSGSDDHDGSEHRWEAGDLICIPPMAAHSHANEGDRTAMLLSVWSHHPANEFLGGFEHIADATGGSGS